jgi:hypothetical protein
VAGSFTVGALAVAAREANAVGAVRLTLLPRKLEVELLRAGSFNEGYIPGGLTRFVRFSVPYSAVRGLVRRERGVILSLDAAAATPYNRFFLTHFTDLPLEALASVHKRRGWLRALNWLVPVPLAAFVVEALPDAIVSGLVGRASAFGLLALALAYAVRGAGRWVELGSPLSTRLRDALEMRLAQRMGYHPALVHETDPFDVPVAALEALGLEAHRVEEIPIEPVRPLLPVRLEAPAVPAPVAAVRAVAAPPPVITAPRPARSGSRWLVPAFAVAAVLIALVGARWVRDLEPTASEVAVARAGIPTDSGPTVEEAAVPSLPTCSCERADSPLWRTGLPVLSTLMIPKAPADSIAPVKNRRGRFRYDFDVAVVNNAAEALKDVRVVLTFARRNEKNERVGATDRGLFWEGLLGPAKSVKWNVKAPGTELRVDMDEKRMLAADAGLQPDTVAPASADGFEKLLRAKQPAVRLHAAMMLAYLGDPRAEEAVRGLGTLTGDAAFTQERILRALRPLKVCDVKFEQEAMQACAYNGTDAPITNATLAEYGPDGRKVEIGEPIPAKTGLVVSAPKFGGEADELELVTR